MSGGGVAAIVIVSLLLVGGSVAGYFVYKKKDIIRWRQFSYARQGQRHSVLSRDLATYQVFKSLQLCMEGLTAATFEQLLPLMSQRPSQHLS